MGWEKYKGQIMSNRKKQRNKVAAVDESATEQNVLTDETVTQTDAESTAPTIERPSVPEQADGEPLELAEPKPKRVWEVDFVRGLMILFVVWDHFMWDVRYVGSSTYNSGLFQWLFELSKNYYTGTLRKVTHDVFVTMFVLTSGVSCSFSRSNGRRAIKMCAFAILFSAVTYAVSAMFNTNLTIYFNVIHVIALSVLLYTAIEWIGSKCTANWQKNIFGVVYFAITMTALVLGHCAKADNSNWLDVIFGKSEWRTAIWNKFRAGGDYLSFLPDFGWFLVGAFLGKIVYRKKESVFPSVDTRYVSPLTFCGRYSIWIYFGSQVVMYGFIYLLHVMYTVL